MFENKDYIYTVYKEKSFSKAAEKLFISQPSLSLTIKKAEKRIGTQLFDRSTTPITLTESGEAYINCIEQIMDIERGYQNYLNELNELKSGSISIGGTNFFISYILPPYINQFLTKYPLLHVKLVEADTSTLERKLFTGDLDLVLENYDLDESIYTRRDFYRERLILAVPAQLPQNKKAKKYSLTAEDIIRDKHKDLSVPGVPLHLFENAPFTLLKHGNDTRKRADAVFLEHQINPKPILEMDQLASAYHTTCRGLGISFISDTLIKELPPAPGLLYYKIDSIHADRDIFFYHKTNKYITRAMQEFLHITSTPNHSNNPV